MNTPTYTWISAAVPDLYMTCMKYLRSVKPLLSDEQVGRGVGAEGVPFCEFGEMDCDGDGVGEGGGVDEMFLLEVCPVVCFRRSDPPTSVPSLALE